MKFYSQALSDLKKENDLLREEVGLLKQKVLLLGEAGLEHSDNLIDHLDFIEALVNVLKDHHGLDEDMVDQHFSALQANRKVEGMMNNYENN